MKIRFLVDAQLPPTLARWLTVQGHTAEHVADVKLASVKDRAIWEYARTVGAVILSKDEDFAILRSRQTGPPAVVWLRIGNTTRRGLLSWFPGTKPGQATIHLSARDDSSSLLPITERQNALFPGTGAAGTKTIRVVRLADEMRAQDLAAPALLKLDVQGFELQALEGCENLLDRFTWVYVECSFIELYAGQALADTVTAWLRERGFGLRGVYHMAYDDEGRAVQADFMFARN